MNTTTCWILNLPSNLGNYERQYNEEDSTTEEIASRYIERTTEDLEKLQVRPPTFMPKATDFIKEMIEIVSDLVEKKHAYVVEPAAGALSSYVYFEISSASDMFLTLTV